MNYSTQDSRLAAYLMIHGVKFEGTELKYQDEDDRVLLRFIVDDENKFADLKRKFFEDGLVPALRYANALKTVMHTIREARELARQVE
jgi:hypothetical protein